MILDNRTLIFSLMLVCALMAASLAVVVRGGERGEIGKWVAALLLQALGWLTVLGRGILPDAVSIVAANLLMAASYALMLAAIAALRGLPWPRGACLLPPAATALACLLLVDNFALRVAWTSLFYSVQFALILRALGAAPEIRQGRARWLLIGATVAAMLALALRAGAALLGADFATLASPVAAHPAQMVVFVVALATATVGSLGFILVIMERTDREIRALAMTDSLTQVCNRRAFIERAEQEYAAAQRSRTPLTLLMIDVDHFKRINDDHGHLAGDEVLVEIARELSARLRRQDIIGRYGGEEFCVVAPNTDLAGAHVLAESLRSVLEATPLTPHAIRVTISIGITVCPATCAACQPDLTTMLGQADAALYEAKRGGRNRANCATIGCAALAFA